jgi:fatty acid desaturase
MGLTMVPCSDSLPEVLPTERLTVSGMPVPAIRADLRRIASFRNVGSVALCWAQALGVVAVVVAAGHPLAYAAAVVVQGASHARFAILAHEAAHRLLFRHKGANDLVGRWLLAYPSLIPFEAYRRAHFAHHRDEFGPDEPDMNLYEGYPVTRSSLRRKLWRDARGSSGWKSFAPLLRALRSGPSRPVAVRILAVQAALLAGATAAGRPEVYVVLWFVPWMTSWRVANRLRAIAEHGGMERSRDRRRTTHHVRQRWLPRCSIVPFNTGWHLAHHVDMGVPWRNLPRLHDELVASGWVSPDLVHRSYSSLWRALSSRPERSAA